LISCSKGSVGESLSVSELPLEEALSNKNKGLFQSTAYNYTILSFISPACEHCNYQTQALIADHNQRPEDLSLIFFADIHPDSLVAYSREFVYDTVTTTFLWDESGRIAQKMGVTSYPTMFLYDTAGVHLQTIVGEAKPSYVYKFFHGPN
ncbi:MAG: hypothetical protein AAF597_04990, partial [Bacteroidota bacterium]